MKHKLFFIIVLLFLFGACMQKQENNPYIVIDLAENIDETANDITLNDIFELERVIPLETSDSFLLSSFNFGNVNEQEFLIFDMHTAYCVNKESGKPRLILNRRGQGRGEYINISRATLDSQGNILIFCPSKKMLLKYSSNGDYIDNRHGDSICGTVVYSNDFYAISHSFSSKSKYLISIYDKSWNLVRQDFPRTKDNTIMNVYNYFREINGECYLAHLPIRCIT